MHYVQTLSSDQIETGFRTGVVKRLCHPPSFLSIAPRPMGVLWRRSGKWLCRKVGRRRGEKRREDSGTHFYHLFNFSSYFAKFSSVDRNCVVPRFLSSSFVQCKAKVLGLGFRVRHKDSRLLRLAHLPWWRLTKLLCAHILVACLLPHQSRTLPIT